MRALSNTAILCTCLIAVGCGKSGPHLTPIKLSMKQFESSLQGQTLTSSTVFASGVYLGYRRNIYKEAANCKTEMEAISNADAIIYLKIKTPLACLAEKMRRLGGSKESLNMTFKTVGLAVLNRAAGWNDDDMKKNVEKYDLKTQLDACALAISHDEAYEFEADGIVLGCKVDAGFMTLSTQSKDALAKVRLARVHGEAVPD